MKKILTLFCIVSLCALVSSASFAAKPVDNDGDGCKSNVDCNDNDPSVCSLNCNNECAPQPPECFSCGDYLNNATACDADCKCEWLQRGKKGSCKELAIDTCGSACPDNDGDGFNDAACDGLDCNDDDASVYFGAPEIACDGIDQDCSGSDAVDASCTDNDSDGYTADVDCNDSDSNINPGAAEICDDTIDQNCDGADEVCPPPVCPDSDGDGYTDAACGGTDCNDNDNSIFPGATEVCGDGIDQNCDNTDIPCGTGHDSITQYLGPQTCIACHEIEAQDMLNSLHMTWSGPTTELTNTNGEEKGKAVAGINTFCTYAMSSKGACFSCHVRADGNAPHAPDVNDVDCLMCHNDTYQRKFVEDLDNPVTVTNILNETKDYYFGLQDAEGNYTTVPDYDNMPAGTTMVDIAKNVHMPTRASCLRCHAKAGGGDWTKRGDMGLSTKAPTVTEDVHMSPDAGGADLTCSACHAASAHKISGRGIDLRQTEAPDPKCTDCHSASPHSDSTLNRHASGQVACQVCHIREFGKGGATEMSRDWYQPVWNPAFCAGQGGFVGHEVKVSNVKPDYRWFDGTSYVYNLGETIQPNADGTYTIAKANGEIFDGKSKIVPIKDHWSVMPLHDESGQMIPPVIMEMFMTGDFDKAVQAGMDDQGMTGSYTIVDANTEMLITHGVEPKSMAPTCTDCHDYSGETPDGIGMVPFSELGYHTWPAMVKNCTLCHTPKSGSWEQVHSLSKHQFDGGSSNKCSYCHTSEPTGFVKPTSDLCNDCHGYISPSGFSSGDHKKHIAKSYECAVCHTF